MFRDEDGTVTPGILRVRFGEVEARGVALTPRGRERYEAAMAAADPAAVWATHFPSTDAEMAAQGLAYYRGGDPSAPIVYEDFLPASAAGIFRSTWIATRKPVTDPTMPATTSIGWPGQSADTFTTRMRSMTRSPRRSGADNH